MIKYTFLAMALLVSSMGLANDQQIEAMNVRLEQQSDYLYSALSAKTSAGEVKKIRDKVEGHVDVRFYGEYDHVDMRGSFSPEETAYRNIRKLAYLKTFLGEHFSASEVKMLLINANLIATFGKDKLGN